MAAIIDAVLKLKDGFSATLDKVNNRINDNHKAMNRAIRGINATKPAFEAMAGAATVGAVAIGAAVKVGADFEQGMAKVGAISGASADDMAKLTAQAEELGAKTQFSATQSAEAMSYLAMAGWKTNDIMGAMPGLLNLAAASGEDLATVSDILSDDMTAFGISAENAGHVADVFAAASSNANTNVAMLGETFKYAAPVAGALGYSLEDVSVAAGLMANAGIKASQAGTALRAGMLRMVAPPKEAAMAMERYGISVTDAEGNMKPMIVMMQELRSKLGGLDQATQAVAASSIFGTEATSGWLAIINAGSEDFDKLTNSIADCDGKSQEMADKMNNTLGGAMKRVVSALESIAISTSNALLPILTPIADGIAKIAGAFGEFAKAHPAIVQIGVALVALVGVVGAVGLAVVTAAGALGGLAAAIPALTGLPAALATVGGAVGGIIAPIAGAVSGIVGFVTSLAALPVVLAGIVAGFVIFSQLRAHWDELKNVAQVVVNRISEYWESMQVKLQPAIQAIGDGFSRLGDAFSWLSSRFAGDGSILISVANTIGSVIVFAFETAINYVVMTAQVFGTIINGMANVLMYLGDFVGNVFAGNWQGAWNAIGNIVSATCDMIKGVFSSVIDFVSSGIDNIMGKAMGIGDKVKGIFGISTPGFATGTDYAPGGWATINERGGELVNLPQGAQVIPHDESLARMYNAGQQSMVRNSTSNVTIPKLADSIVIREESDIDRITSQLVFKIKQASINQMVGAF